MTQYLKHTPWLLSCHSNNTVFHQKDKTHSVSRLNFCKSLQEKKLTFSVTRTFSITVQALFLFYNLIKMTKYQLFPSCLLEFLWELLLLTDDAALKRSYCICSWWRITLDTELFYSSALEKNLLGCIAFFLSSVTLYFSSHDVLFKNPLKKTLCNFILFKLNTG